MLIRSEGNLFIFLSVRNIIGSFLHSLIYNNILFSETIAKQHPIWSESNKAIYINMRDGKKVKKENNTRNKKIKENKGNTKVIIPRFNTFFRAWSVFYYITNGSRSFRSKSIWTTISFILLSLLDARLLWLKVKKRKQPKSQQERN